jgi:transcriptional antiterminator NusG
MITENTDPVIAPQTPPAPPAESVAPPPAAPEVPATLTTAEPPAPAEASPPPAAETPPEATAPPVETPAEEPPPQAQEEAPPEAALEAPVEAPPVEPSKKHWYVVKVQSGREESIKDAIERRVKIEGLEEFFGQIVIPVEKVTEVRNNKKRVKEHKLYPGYLMAEVEFNDRILYLFRETSGVGDFVGATATRPPQPMSQREVDRMILGAASKEEGKEKVIAPKFAKGDKLRVRDGIFSGMEGEVKEILEAKHAVKLELQIFGRPTSVELEYWQVEPV